MHSELVVDQNEKSTITKSGEAEEIYIGFPKNDYEPREGRKGRVVKDDPRRYPDRDALTGGWAGGEAGLWKFRDAIKVRILSYVEAAQLFLCFTSWVQQGCSVLLHCHTSFNHIN